MPRTSGVSLSVERLRILLRPSRFTAAWKRDGHTFTLRVEAPHGTTATAGVPVAGEVRVDGTAVWRDGRALRDGVVLRDGYVQVPGLTGTSTVTARG